MDVQYSTAPTWSLRHDSSCYGVPTRGHHTDRQPPSTRVRCGRLLPLALDCQRPMISLKSARHAGVFYRHKVSHAYHGAYSCCSIWFATTLAMLTQRSITKSRSVQAPRCAQIASCPHCHRVISKSLAVIFVLMARAAIRVEQSMNSS